MNTPIDWAAIELAYTTTDTPVPTLAEQHGCSAASIYRRARVARWRRNASPARASASDWSAGLCDTVDGLVDVVKRIIMDSDQFQRYVYQDKSTGEPFEKVLNARNLKTVRDMAEILRIVADTARGIYGVLTPEAQYKMELAFKKLSIEQDKRCHGWTDDDSEETGVILLPEPEGA